ncbi:hypothetical protein ABZP36_021025 [Zizania latifolia]
MHAPPLISSRVLVYILLPMSLVDNFLLLRFCLRACVQSEFFVSLALTALFYVPGIVYSVWVILKTPPEPPGIDGERPYYILA